MDILILSDSHGRADAIREVLARQIRRPDAIVFLGDGVRDLGVIPDGIPVYAVSGNCDLFLTGGGYPSEGVTALGGHTVFFTHGHAYGVKSGLGRLLLKGVEANADILLFGHTHLPTLQMLNKGETAGFTTLERPLYLFNPGSLKEGSFGTLTLSGDTALFSHGHLGSTALP